MAEEKTVSEAIRSASAELSAKPDKSETKVEKAEKVEKVESQDVGKSDDGDDWDGPKWVHQWKKPSREAMRKLAALEGAKDVLPSIYKEIEERYDYSGKQQAEFEKYRKRFDPYEPVLSPLEQRFQLQGVDPRVGLQQMVAANDFLQRDPDQALLWLAQNFKPRDAKAFFQAAAQQLGVDLSGLAQSQPWVDPAIKTELDALKNANRQVMEQQQRVYQQQYQQAAQQVAGAIKAFKEAQDEQGNPKYPHYDRLESRMTQILNAEGPQPLEQLYEKAMWLDPELREAAVSERAKQAQQKAIQEAQAKNAEAEEALKASRNVTGSKTVAGSKPKPADLRGLLRQEAKRLSG